MDNKIALGRSEVEGGRDIIQMNEEYTDVKAVCGVLTGASPSEFCLCVVGCDGRGYRSGRGAGRIARYANSIAMRSIQGRKSKKKYKNTQCVQRVPTSIFLQTRDKRENVQMERVDCSPGATMQSQ